MKFADVAMVALAELLTGTLALVVIGMITQSWRVLSAYWLLNALITGLLAAFLVKNT